jgi:DNA-binding transcriptional MerR regulator
MACNTELPQPLLDSQHVHEYLGVPVGTLNAWAYRGVGPPFIKVGRHRRYRLKDIENWLDRQTKSGDAS